MKLLKDRLGDADFLTPGPLGGRASFNFAQAQLRRLLVHLGAVFEHLACLCTLHRLKVTGLCWDLQLDVDGRARHL